MKTETDPPDCLWLRAALDAAQLAALDKIASGDGPGKRIGRPSDDTASALRPIRSLIDSHALPGARLVRVVWFSKGDTTNWGVPWHQDRVIAVNARADRPGFANWSQKAGIWHCDPPTSLLHRMRFVRVHLDDADDENGAMQIALGSHREGIIPEGQSEAVTARHLVEICTASRGDVQVLPMLTLHRSLPARSPAPRRAIRLDYAAEDLPPPLRWSLDTE